MFPETQERHSFSNPSSSSSTERPSTAQPSGQETNGVSTPRRVYTAMRPASPDPFRFPQRSPRRRLYQHQIAVSNI